MNKLIQNKYKYLYLVLLILSLVPLLLKFATNCAYENKKNEIYKPELINLNSIESVLDYTDSLALINHVDLRSDTAAYVDLSSVVIEKRFHFGTATYILSENWIAYVLGRLVWNHLSAIVIPNDILKHDEGLCSQQTMVFMDLLKNKGIPFRTVGLGFKEGPGHFLCEVRYNNEWNLFDVSIEPNWSRIEHPHKSLEYYLANRSELSAAYEGKISEAQFNQLFRKIEYGDTNNFPAKNMLLFHRITFWLTYIIPVFFMALFILSWFDKKNKVHPPKF